MDDNTLRIENLRQLIKDEYAGKQRLIAERLQRQPDYISRLLNGRKNLSGDLARDFETLLGKPKYWLDQQHSPNGEQPRNKEFDQNVVFVSEKLRQIPVISAVQAGKMTEISEAYLPGAGFDIEYTSDLSLSIRTFALEIEGESMLPEFRPGDRVIIDPDLSPNPGDFVVAKNTREEATFKKYRPRGMDAQGNMVFELIPLNDDYPTLRSDIDHIHIIGVMVEHRKKYRRRS